jgi:hypothetical protein
MSGNMLDELQARKAALAEEQVRDLQVPIWTHPEFRFRVRPLDHAVITRIMARVEKARGAAMSPATLDAHASVLAAATIAVVIGDEGTEQAEIPLDSPLLREKLGVPEASTAAQVVRAITLRDGDTIALGVAAIKHSGFADEAVTEALSGE